MRLQRDGRIRGLNTITSKTGEAGGQPRTTQWIAVLLILTMLVIEFAGFLFATGQQNAVIAIRNKTRDVRIVQQALGDAEQGVTDFILTEDKRQLGRYFTALATLRPHRETTLVELQRVAPVTDPAGRTSALAVLESFESTWDRSIDLVRQGRPEEARVISQEEVDPGMAAIRDSVTRYLAIRNAEAEDHERRGTLLEKILLVLQLVGGALTIILLISAFRSGAIEARGRRLAIREAVAAREQIEKLFRMTDMLQSASGYEDANAILNATAHGLMPDLGCALFVFNNSRDRLDLSSAWNLPEGYQPPQHIAPTSCWAVKRGKTHLNLGGVGGLRCAHQAAFDGALLEVPMTARGEVYGLLSFVATGAGAEERMRSVHGMATALAEAMSLALSNIALREKLRNQALRDSLTGLYNRRYMEDMLQRFAQLSERTARPLSVVMIDLDHFKRLNDEHGHGTGDAVLRDVAGAIGGALRQSDVACRAGGEELIVLLPDSGLDDAVAKADHLRARIEALSENHGFPITASFGVAASPENATAVAELVKLADAALYEAKRAGRNRVMAAPRALQHRGSGPTLAAAE